MPVCFTPAQQNAITARNPQLLVSAAAGSGKTAVLVERILSLVRQDGYSVDRMLVVTFTNAAAAEMRERLEQRLHDAALEEPGLRRQAELVETAQISTLHAFCQKLVREYFEAVEIDPQAALCDETMRAKTLGEAMEEALNEAYEKATEDENLRALTRKFSENEIADMLSSLYGFLMAQPSPFAWLAACAAHAYTQADLLESPMAQTLLLDCRILLEGALSLFEEARLLARDPFCREGYAQTIQADGQLLLSLKEAAAAGLPTLMGEITRAAYPKLPAYRLTDEREAAVADRFKDLRARYKKLTERMKDLLPPDPGQSIADLNAMQPALRGLEWTAGRMHALFMERKSKRALLDFNDLEHMTLDILRRPELQKAISARFDAIFVDEYQDISGIQEAILQGLHRKPLEGKLPFLCFYVGDVKQSIYRFRQADPTLFMEKQRCFSPDPGAACRKISLNQNFRSRGEVVRGVNRVFTHVMRGEVTEIEYDEDARLHAEPESVGDPPTELHILGGEELRAAKQPALEAALIAEKIKAMVDTPLYDREGKDTGNKLHYRDMVILLPAAKGVADVVQRTLTAAGVPVYTEDGQSGMGSEEIRQLLSHLRLLDNLMDDLALLAALRGPLYGLTEKELASIRLCKPEKGASFLNALRAAGENADPALAQRCRDILESLHRERFLQRSMPLDEYMWDFLSRSGMYGFYGAQPGGKLRQANLRMLCNRAGEHMKNRGGELQDFLYSVAAVEGVRDDKSPTVLSPWEDVVRVMTIHKSKGLECPVVFVMGLGGSLHRRGPGKRLAMHPRLGVAMEYRNEAARTKRDTLLGSAIALRVQAEEKAERARVLYVALTRARDKLVMVGSAPALAKDFANAQATQNPLPTFPSENEENPSENAYTVWEAKSMLEWIWQTRQNADEIRVLEREHFSTSPLWETKPETHFSTESTFFPQKTGGWRVVFHIEPSGASLWQEGADETQSPGQNAQAAREKRLENLLQEASPTADPTKAAIETANETDEKQAATLPPLFPETDPLLPLWHFPHAPLKLGVTAYCRMADAPAREGFLEGEDSAPAESPEVKRLPLAFSRPKLLADLPALPAYLRGTEEQTALLRGVATHKALSLIALPPLRAAISQRNREEKLQAAVEKELALLQMEGLLSPEECGLADGGILAGFFGSPLGLRMLSSERLHREWSFNLHAPALCESLLQGVIDLCFLENGGWVLVDYKTDRVDSPQALWKTYGLQMALYRRALQEGTGLPVKEAVLFALRLGEGASAPEDFS